MRTRVIADFSADELLKPGTKHERRLFSLKALAELLRPKRGSLLYELAELIHDGRLSVLWSVMCVRDLTHCARSGRKIQGKLALHRNRT